MVEHGEEDLPRRFPSDRARDESVARGDFEDVTEVVVRPRRISVRGAQGLTKFGRQGEALRQGRERIGHRFILGGDTAVGSRGGSVGTVGTVADPRDKHTGRLEAETYSKASVGFVLNARISRASRMEPS